MPISRRNFLVRGSVSAAAVAIAPLISQAEKTQAAKSPNYRDWEAVRREFNLSPEYVHLGLFYIASHPRPVRESIEQYRRRLDANPFVTVESSLFESQEKNIPLKVCNTIANYIGSDAADIALTQNTTTGLALIYHGLPLRAGDEVLTTAHDHFVQHEAIRLATERSGATWRKIALFDSYQTISPDEVVARIRKAIAPKTRVVGTTWVHSASGVRPRSGWRCPDPRSKRRHQRE